MPPEVTLELDVEHAERAKASTTAWNRDERRYRVFLGGEFIGIVESIRTESWRKSGRIRTSLIGHPKEWWARTKDGRSVTRTAYSRQAAVDALVREATSG